MSKIERDNKIANFLEKLMAGFSFVLVSMIAFLFVNFEKLPPLKIIILAVTCFGVIGLLGIFLKLYLQKLNEIGEYEE